VNLDEELSASVSFRERSLTKQLDTWATGFKLHSVAKIYRVTKVCCRLIRSHSRGFEVAFAN